MFNTFFQGSVDDLLKQMESAPAEEINKVGNENEVLNREEIIAAIMDEAKCPREEAERLATEIQLEEFNRIIQPMIEKGLIELTGYDSEGMPEYKPTPKGLELLS